MENKKSLHLGLGLLNSTGGTTKAVADFQQALPGSVVASVCDAEAFRKEGPYRNDWLYYNPARSFLGRAYSRLAYDERTRLIEGLPSLDSVFCHMLYRYNTNLACSISRRFGVPYFAVPHGCLDPWVFTYRGWQKKAWLWGYGNVFLKGAAAVVFASEAEKRKACQTAAIRNGVVIHWPVDPRPFLMNYKNNVRQELGIPIEARVLIMFGRLDVMKRPLETIRAVAASALKNLHLLVVGPESTVSREQCILAASGLGDRFHYVGPVYGDEKWRYLSAANGYISLSARENFNYSMAECLSLGLPVILSRGNDLALELKSIKCGWMLADESEASAIEAIKEFSAASIDMLAQMGDNGRRFVANELNRSVFNRNIQSLISQFRSRM